MDPAWASLKDDELLGLRICELGVKIEGSELEPRIAHLYEALGQRGIALRPPCYLGDEWFSPNGVPAIAIPFYLAHPRLRQLELHMMLEVEGGTREWCDQLLFHECGHALEHAYRFSRSRRWRDVFGNPELEYAPETYRPRPYSKSFVRHLPDWYAQSHPEEDWAETFAVWLALAKASWRERYAGWKALEKLEYVDLVVTAAARREPLVRGGRRGSEASRMKTTLARYYAARRRLYAEDYPDFWDVDLRRIFAAGRKGGETAARFMRRHRKAIVGAVVHWTDERKYAVDALVQKLIRRAEQLELAAPESDAVLLELGAFLAALVTNHRHTGRWKRSV